MIVAFYSTGQVPDSILKLCWHMASMLRKKGAEIRATTDQLGFSAADGALNDVLVILKPGSLFPFGLKPLVPVSNALLCGLQGNGEKAKFVIAWYTERCETTAELERQARNYGIQILNASEPKDRERLISMVRKMNQVSPAQAKAAEMLKRLKR